MGPIPNFLFGYFFDINILRLSLILLYFVIILTFITKLSPLFMFFLIRFLLKIVMFFFVFVFYYCVINFNIFPKKNIIDEDTCTTKIE